MDLYMFPDMGPGGGQVGTGTAVVAQVTLQYQSIQLRLNVSHAVNLQDFLERPGLRTRNFFRNLLKYFGSFDDVFFRVVYLISL